jgi:uncharacterized protein (DUF934 family)
MPLLKHNQFTTDDWSHLADDAAVAGNPRFTVTFDRLRKDWNELVGLDGLVGIRLANTDRAEELRPYLNRISLIILAFPAFGDGRSYSLAAQLRDIGYRGELRATGNVLPDQLQFMIQVGIDSFDVSERFSLDTWQKASKQMSLAYQRGLYRRAGEREVWSERHQGFAAWEEQPHAG